LLLTQLARIKPQKWITSKSKPSLQGKTKYFLES
jgi:hypothetical protein